MRAHGLLAAAVVRWDQDGLLVAQLAEPQRGIAAGQALVMYDRDRVIGSATITSAQRSALVP
jgi:tRNA-specific 2-thiouridylase